MDTDERIWISFHKLPIGCRFRFHTRGSFFATKTDTHTFTDADGGEHSQLNPHELVYPEDIFVFHVLKARQASGL